MNGFSEQDLHSRVLQQIQARHNGDIQVSTDHEKKIRFDFPNTETGAQLNPPSPTLFDTTMTLMYEDHTLGNVLRYYLMSRSDVQAAGYVIPHPLEPIMKLHLQSSTDGRRIIREELRNISAECRKLSTIIEKAAENHKCDCAG